MEWVMYENTHPVFFKLPHSTHYYLRLYGIGHMVNDQKDNEIRNSLQLLNGLMSLLYPASQTG